MLDLRTLFAILVLPLSAAAQAPGPRHVVRPDLDGPDLLHPRSFHQDRVLVKFREGFRVRLVDSKLVSPDGLDLSTVRRLLAGLRIEPVFTRTPGELDEERAAIRARSRKQEREEGLPEGSFDDPADLANWYRVRTGTRKRSLFLMRRLLDLPQVETVEGEFRPEAILPAQDPAGKRFYGPHLYRRRIGGSSSQTIPTPFFEPNQLYLMSSPGGIGYIDAIGILGTKGHPALRVVHLEAAWIFDHEDIPKLVKTNVLGKSNFGPLDIKIWRNHGTAICGLLTAATDSKGIRGMVPDSRLFVSSWINGYANFISLAMKGGRSGDVFTCSAVFGVAVGSKGYHAPFDHPQVTYDAIRNAVLKGFAFTLAAGNTGADLGDKRIFGTRYLPASTPSGAIRCGATFGPKTRKISWSNYGDRVEMNGWGALVTTTGYGDLFNAGSDVNAYTWRFGGTSAAAPQVAGVLASLQAIGLEQRGKTFSPRVLLQTLGKTGTPILGKIGKRPDLFAAMKALGLYGGLRILNEPRPGEAMVVSVEMPPSVPFLLHAGSRRIRKDIGLGFPLFLDPAAQIPLAGGFGNGRSRRFGLPVPKDARLHDTKIFFQAAYLDPKAGVRLTNGAVGRIQ